MGISLNLSVEFAAVMRLNTSKQDSALVVHFHWRTCCLSVPFLILIQLLCVQTSCIMYDPA